MPLQIGTRVGPYEILTAVGSGGMGEVWKARDTRLDRIVAIKTIHGPFSERFEREARAISALNHPHICALYDVGEHDGAGYLVMEFVEGAPLKGPLRLDQGLKYAAQICDALGAAHHKGIVHRDLKPDNILLTKAGVKLLDFGLAKEVGPAEAGPHVLAEEAATKALTGAHVILGTPQYMAPEQIEGRDADARTDLFAFGCVLYELLTGQKAFEGKTPSSTMAAILATEPRPLRELQPLTPLALERSVKRCLEKDPDDRWQTARDLKAELDWIAAGGGALRDAAPQSPTRRTWSRAAPWIAAMALLGAGITGVMAWRRKAAPDQPVLQMEINAPAGVTFNRNAGQFKLSPDGRHLVFVGATKEGKRLLWFRPLEASVAIPLAGTEGAYGPFWAPDSQWVGFFANGKLQKINVTGGQPQLVCASLADSGTWNDRGVIVFAEPGKGLQQVAAAGGTVSAIRDLETTAETLQRDPRFLPDGNHLLYISIGKQSQVMLGSLDGTKPRVLFSSNTSPASFAPSAAGSGWLLYTTDGLLYARPFDPLDSTFIGEATPLTAVGRLVAGPRWSTSDTGLLAFRRSQSPQAQLTWFGRDGRLLGTIGDPGDIASPRISPDQQTIAFSRREQQSEDDILLFDVGRTTTTRFTLEPGADTNPVWSADGSRVLYSSIRPEGRMLVERPANGLGAETIVKSQFGLVPTSVSRDGRWLTASETLGPVSRIVLRSRPDDGKSIPFFEAPFRQAGGSISPRGSWMLHAANPAGRFEVFVQSLPKEAGGIPTTAGRFQISNGGGNQPVWRADGKEFFYIAANGTMMAVPVESGPDFFRPGVPQALFQTRLAFDVNTAMYDVSADGQRFLITEPANDAGDPPITVIVNWPRLIQK